SGRVCVKVGLVSVVSVRVLRRLRYVWKVVPCFGMRLACVGGRWGLVTTETAPCISWCDGYSRRGRRGLRMNGVWRKDLGAEPPPPLVFRFPLVVVYFICPCPLVCCLK
ncbi:unnamed protein product, partial [Laminaria digitata]